MDVYVTLHQHSRTVGEAFARAVRGNLRSVRCVRQGECATFGILRGAGDVIDIKIKSGETFWYIDHGYIGAGHYDGFYRVVRNGLHSVRPKPNPARLESLSWRTSEEARGDAILFVPPSEATSQFLGIDPNVWLAEAGSVIGEHTDRRFLVTTKQAKNGTELLSEAHALVTCQSNLATEAIRRGIPVFVLDGEHPAEQLQRPIETIDGPEPVSIDERMDWAARLANVQFRLDELSDAYSREFNQDGS